MTVLRAWRLAAGWLAPLAVGAGSARADPGGLISRETVAASADVRVIAADGERSWLDGGFGKARWSGGSNGALRVRPELTEATVAWLPRLGWAVSGTIVAIAQNGQQHGVDLSEAFLTFRARPAGAVRATARLGLFWPPVSLEHGGTEWRVNDTITPSAIGSWIGEEVKLTGAEFNLALPAGNGRIALTAAAFGMNDTSGTLLAFRGWALHDEKAVAFGKQPLPPFNGFIANIQPRYTRPVIGISGYVGFYGKLAWTPAAPIRIEAFHYDNRANPQDVNASKEWGWRTRFDTVGAVARIGRVTLRAQGMDGRTVMGFSMAGPGGVGRWVNTRFRSAYLMATRETDWGSLSGRIEAFGTRNHGSQLTAVDDEDGWAATFAGRRQIGDHFALLAEFQHIDSDKDARLRVRIDPTQAQNVAQVALRAHL